MWNIFAKKKNKSAYADDLRSPNIVRLQSTDWYLSNDRSVLDKEVAITTNFGVKTWFLSFNKMIRENGDTVLYFTLASDTPTAGDDVGNYYPAIFLVDGKQLSGVTLKLVSQDSNTVFMTDDPEHFKTLSSFCLSDLSGVFMIIGNDERAIASFPWQKDETYKKLFPGFAASYNAHSYNSWEDWYEAFKLGAGEVRETLPALLDFMDHTPLKRGFEDGVHPIPLGRQFATDFDATKFGMPKR